MCQSTCSSAATQTMKLTLCRPSSNPWRPGRSDACGEQQDRRGHERRNHETEERVRRSVPYIRLEAAVVRRSRQPVLPSLTRRRDEQEADKHVGQQLPSREERRALGANRTRSTTATLAVSRVAVAAADEAARTGSCPSPGSGTPLPTPERRRRVGLRPRDEQDRPVPSSGTSASTKRCSPTASANALWACSPPNGTSSSGRARPASTSPWVTAPIETSATTASRRSTGWRSRAGPSR